MCIVALGEQFDPPLSQVFVVAFGCLSSQLSQVGHLLFEQSLSKARVSICIVGITAVGQGHTCDQRCYESSHDIPFVV